MKSPLLLWNALADELGKELGVDTSRDIETVSRRCEDEGVKPFLTITLPTIARALSFGLECGRWSSHDATAFRCFKGLPRFLGGFLELIFDRESGAILLDPDPRAIFAVRQLSGLFGKVNEVCEDRRVLYAMREWIEVDLEVGKHDATVTESMLSAFESACLAIWSHTFARIDRMVDQYELRPRHSNGSNADGLRGNQKWEFVEWTNRLETVFPFVDYGISSHRYWQKAKEIRFLDPGAERPSKVLAVPKTALKPRIISMEPSYMQYMQQGLFREFMREFESPQSGYSDVIQLRNREHNQAAACLGSRNGSLATLDLSEASDRLSYRLVMRMFTKFPHLYEGVDACRTTHAQVGDLGTIPLLKFAPMGSALTFPLQTVVFTTIAFMGIAESYGITPGSAWQRYRKKVRVFGDDIIVPVDAVEDVIRLLEAYGLKVNRHKSFWNGKFRESCGGDYFNGHDVSYVKVRSWLPDSLRDVEEVEATVSLRTHFYEYGLWQTASFLDGELERLLKFYPPVGMSSPVLGRRTFLTPEGERTDASLQRPISKGYIAKRQLPSSPLDDTEALLKWFTEEHGEMPTAAVNGFERAGRPQHATLQLRWGPTE